MKGTLACGGSWDSAVLAIFSAAFGGRLQWGRGGRRPSCVRMVRTLKDIGRFWGNSSPYHFGAFCLYPCLLLHGAVSIENQVPDLVSLGGNLGQGGLGLAVTKGVGDSNQGLNSSNLAAAFA